MGRSAQLGGRLGLVCAGVAGFLIVNPRSGDDEPTADELRRAAEERGVNGRLFLNNLSLGIYAGLVHRRERHRRRGEALARARALWRIAGERHRLRARVDGETMRARILLVANNAYEIDTFTVGARSTLD